MLRRASVLALVSFAACKSHDAPKASPASASGPPADAGAPADANHPGARLPPPPTPGSATAEECAKAAIWVTNSTIPSELKQQGVPADKIGDAAKELGATFGVLCTQDVWPEMVIDCYKNAPGDAVSYQRCIDRVPSLSRTKWDAALEASFAKTGGNLPPHPDDASPAPASGVPFETLCAGFVAEVARFDSCTGEGMYVPEIEDVFVAGRAASAGGLVPDAAAPKLKQLCEERALITRDAVIKFCGPNPKKR